MHSKWIKCVNWKMPSILNSHDIFRVHRVGEQGSCYSPKHLREKPRWATVLKSLIAMVPTRISPYNLKVNIETVQGSTMGRNQVSSIRKRVFHGNMWTGLGLVSLTPQQRYHSVKSPFLILFCSNGSWHSDCSHHFCLPRAPRGHTKSTADTAGSIQPCRETWQIC